MQSLRSYTYLLTSILLQLLIKTIRAQDDPYFYPNITIVSACPDPVYISNTTFWPQSVVTLTPSNNILFDYLYIEPGDGSYDIRIGTTDNLEGDGVEITYSIAWGGFYWYVRVVGVGFTAGKIWVGTTGDDCASVTVDESGVFTWEGDEENGYVSCEPPQSFLFSICVE